MPMIRPSTCVLRSVWTVSNAVGPSSSDLGPMTYDPLLGQVVMYSPSGTLWSFDGAAWSEALLAMRHDEPTLRPAMDLEGVKRWLPADKSGYETLTVAMREQGYLP